MTVTLELLEALKASNGGASDYACAKLLGVTHQTISNYRTERVPMADQMALKACELMKKDATVYLLRLHVERAKCDSEKTVWNAILDRISNVKRLAEPEPKRPAYKGQERRAA